MNTTIASKSDIVTEADVELLRQVPGRYRQLADALDRRIIGQDEIIRDLFVALAVQGHVLMIGVPGLAKTLIDPQPRRIARSAFPAHSVHARPDAQRHHRHGNSGGDRRRAAASSVSCAARCSPA